jgi:hypothetical protein
MSKLRLLDTQVKTSASLKIDNDFFRTLSTPYSVKLGGARVTSFWALMKGRFQIYE